MGQISCYVATGWFDEKLALSNSSKNKKLDLIVQHNDLIETPQFFTLQEKRIIYWLSAHVDIQDEDFKEHQLSVKDFCELVGIDYNGMYNRLANITKGLMKKVIEIRTFNKDSKEVLEQIHLLSYARYEEGLGCVALSFHPQMKRFLLNLKDNFTKTSLSIALKFSSIYSLRFYELMKKDMFLQMSILKISELKVLLGIQAEKYSNYKDFRRRILEPSINEVNKKSDLKIDWVEIRNGKKVEFIRFSMKKVKRVNEKSLSLPKEEGLIVSQHTLDLLRKEFSEDVVQQGLDVLKRYKGEIKNPVLFLKKAIKEGWQPFNDSQKQSFSKESVVKIQREISNLDEDPVCVKIRKLFLEKNGEAEYRSWFYDVDLYVKDERVIVLVKSTFTKNWLEVNYAKKLTDYAEGKRIIFRIKEKRESDSSITVEKQSTLTNKRVYKKNSMHKNQVPTKEPVVFVHKKSLWQKIKSFLR